MTTKHSPLIELKAQANRIAATLKAAERGDRIDVRFAQKIAEARAKESFNVAVVMDDKVITIDMPWATIRSTPEAGLAEWILDQMRQARDVAN
jgi:hypothetical protein